MQDRIILTIDLDFLEKYINEYNQFVATEVVQDEKILWYVTRELYKKHYEEELENEILEGADEFIFRIVNENSNAKFYLLNSHEQVLNYLLDSENNYVYNIDFHHDIRYSLEAVQDSNCSNWVSFGYDKGLIRQYNWINRATSEFPVCKFIPFDNMEWRKIDTASLPKFDAIFFIRSPEFLSEKVYNEFKKRYNELGLNDIFK